MSVRQKDAALLPLVRRRHRMHRAQAVSADPRYSAQLRPDEFNDLIVKTRFLGCARPVRAMIDAHDRMYGDGSGEAFLLGPYLDVLPSAAGQAGRASSGRP